MRRKPIELPVALLRRLLLAALLLFLVTVGAVFLLGRSGKPPPPPTPRAQTDGDDGEVLVMVGEGFEYELRREGRRAFRIEADRIVSKTEDSYSLEGVEIDLVRDDGSEYHIGSRLGTYEVESQAALLEGDVRFRGPRDVELTADALELRRSGNLVLSTGTVRFAFLDRFVGRADRIRINARKSQFIMAGKVEIETRPEDPSPLSLSCQRFTYERDDHVIRTEGDVVLRRGRDRLAAQRLTLTLSEDEKRLRLVRGLWEVTGELWRLNPDGALSAYGLAGDKLFVAFAQGTDQPETIEVESDGEAPARLTSNDGAGQARAIEAHYLVGDFEAGDLRRARAFGRVRIDEYPGFGDPVPVRTLCAETADARFGVGGEPLGAVLEGDVDVHEARLQAHGDRMEARYAEGTVRLTGDLAWALDERGRLEAPIIVYTRDAGSLEAVDGVHALIEGDATLGPGGGESRGPIRVEAAEAMWSGEPGSVLFRTSVRAWQGKNLLLADELLGEPRSSRLTATGRVKTVWRPEKKAAGPAEGGGEAGGPQTEPRVATEGGGTAKPAGLAASDAPLEITAAKMVYERREGLLTYSGGANAHQAGRSLRCVEIQLRQAPGGEDFEELVCDGSARIEDPQSGKTVTGDRAVYVPDSSNVRISGRPVVMRDTKGTEIRGRHLLYDFTTGMAQVQAEPEPEEAETAGTPSVESDAAPGAGSG